MGVRTTAGCILTVFCIFSINPTYAIEVITSGEITIRNQKGTCTIVIPSTYHISKLSSPIRKGQFLTAWDQMMSNKNVCVEPDDTQPQPESEYQEFLDKVGLAEIWNADDGSLELDCIDKQDNLIVAYIFKSPYGAMWSAIQNPLPLKQTESTLTKLKHGFANIVKGDALKTKFTLPFRNMYKSGREDKVPKESFAAFQYCYQAYIMRQAVVDYLKRKPFPSKPPKNLV